MSIFRSKEESIFSNNGHVLADTTKNENGRPNIVLEKLTLLWANPFWNRFARSDL